MLLGMCEKHYHMGIVVMREISPTSTLKKCAKVLLTQLFIFDCVRFNSSRGQSGRTVLLVSIEYIQLYDMRHKDNAQPK